MKLRIVMLYGDEVDAVLIDEGQDFNKLYKEFDKQFRAMCAESDVNGPAHRAWLGFTNFIKSKGVNVIEDYEVNSLG